MPTYQYQCTKCGEDLEAVQKFTDESLTECPSCEGRLRKVFSAVGVVFKGSGFYRTDSRGSSTDSPAAAKSSEGKNGSSSSSSSDSTTKSASGSSDTSGSSGSSKSSDSGSTTASKSSSGASTSSGTGSSAA